MTYQLDSFPIKWAMWDGGKGGSSILYILKCMISIMSIKIIKVFFHKLYYSFQKSMKLCLAAITHQNQYNE